MSGALAVNILGFASLLGAVVALVCTLVDMQLIPSDTYFQGSAHRRLMHGAKAGCVVLAVGFVALIIVGIATGS